MRLTRWVLVVTLGEAVGFSVPAAVGVAVTGASWGPLATLIAGDAAEHVRFALDCRDRRESRSRRCAVTYLSAIGAVFRASRSCEAAGAMDSDQYRCLATGDRVDAGTLPGGRSVNTCRCSDLDLWR